MKHLVYLVERHFKYSKLMVKFRTRNNRLPIETSYWHNILYITKINKKRKCTLDLYVTLLPVTNFIIYFNSLFYTHPERNRKSFLSRDNHIHVWTI